MSALAWTFFALIALRGVLEVIARAADADICAWTHDTHEEHRP